MKPDYLVAVLRDPLLVDDNPSNDGGNSAGEGNNSVGTDYFINIESGSDVSLAAVASTELDQDAIAIGTTTEMTENLIELQNYVCGDPSNPECWSTEVVIDNSDYTQVSNAQPSFNGVNGNLYYRIQLESSGTPSPADVYCQTLDDGNVPTGAWDVLDLDENSVSTTTLDALFNADILNFDHAYLFETDTGTGEENLETLFYEENVSNIDFHLRCFR